jgi:hypothetical protein
MTPIASAASVVAAQAIPRPDPQVPAGAERVKAHPSVVPMLDRIEPLMPHQARVVLEHAALAENITKLEAFVKGEMFARLDSAECALMLAQLQFMRGYEWALRSRVMVWAGDL